MYNIQLPLRVVYLSAHYIHPSIRPNSLLFLSLNVTQVSNITLHYGVFANAHANQFIKFVSRAEFVFNHLRQKCSKRKGVLEKMFRQISGMVVAKKGEMKEVRATIYWSLQVS